MARQTYYITREQKHPLYKTRMLQAGPIELDASAARLYRKLGVDLSDRKPRTARPQLDHDENGTAGGSKAGTQSTRAKGAARKRAKK